MFITELNLYVNFLQEELIKNNVARDARKIKYCQEFYQNLLLGISYYRGLEAETIYANKSFHHALILAEQYLTALNQQYLVLPGVAAEAIA